jgi:hypothetical protein
VAIAMNTIKIKSNIITNDMRAIIALQVRRDGFKATIEASCDGDIITTDATPAQVRFSAMRVLAAYRLAGMEVAYV